MQAMWTKEARVKRVCIGADQVATYIKLGRQRVQGSAYDPYAKAKNPVAAMGRDAMIIASWFNSHKGRWTQEEYVDAYAKITGIQHGPQFWWQQVLEDGLSTTDYRAAQSWAQRHADGNFVDVNLAPATRGAIADLIRRRIKGWPYEKNAMLDLLRFAFHGLAEGSDDLYL